MQRAFSLAGVALDAEKTVLEQAALEIGVELVFHVARQRAPLGSSPFPEPGIALGYELIEQRRLWPVSRIPGWRDEILRLRNVGVRRAHVVSSCTAAV
jgi:hypothetical protein